jgi:hypothetical protein
VAGGRKKAFVAFPSEPADLAAPINAAAAIVRSSETATDLQLWPAVNAFGSHIPDEVRGNIRACDVLVCDITLANLNVYYEAGYAIGSGKTLAPIVNSSFAQAVRNIQRDGIFDNIGFLKYDNSLELAEILRILPSNPLVELYRKPIDHQQPLYLLESFRKTDFHNDIVAALADTNVFYRVFDPAEVPRFSTVTVLADVTASTGVIVPFLAEHVDDSERHNLRAAFLAGLSHGLGRQTLMLELSQPDALSPTDYRDLVHSVREKREIAELVENFAKLALLAGQSVSTTESRAPRSALQQLILGSSAAENEARTLVGYFVETSEFLRTVRGEINVVAGRKGSGKTAIFYRVRDTLDQDRNTVVIDLKPESHQLSLFREELLKSVGVGVFDHMG